MNGYYIKSTGEKIIIIQVNLIILNDRSITQLVIPDGTRYIWVENNHLTELIIPDSVEHIKCWNNYLTELICPDNCEVECDESCRIIRRTMYNRSKRIKSILKQDNYCGAIQ